MKTEFMWEIFYASYFITYPKKGKNNTLFSPPVTGRSIPPEKIPSVLLKFFDRDSNSYPVGITFTTPDKIHKIREMVIRLASGGDDCDSISLEMANRLSQYMDNRSESGLLITLCGKLGPRKRVVILKFPQEVILHTENQNIVQLDEAYATEYGYVKAAIFESSGESTAFWKGRVEDKENSSLIKQAASYWIEEFLLAKTDITDPMGTKILSGIIKDAIDRAPSMDEKKQLITSFQAFRNKEETKTSISDYLNTYVPDRLMKKYFDKIQHESFLDTPFSLLVEEANKIIGYESLELDNGIIIIGPDEVLKQNVNLSDGNHQLIITGVVRNRRLRSAVR